MEKVIGGVTYELKPAMMNKIKHVLHLFGTEDEKAQQELQYAMALASIHVNGELVKEEDLPMVHYLQLLNDVMEVNNLGNESSPQPSGDSIS